MQEAIKLTTDPSAPDAKARRSAQNTLYTVLDNGLRMLHPFMPFVTEELWQRLPRRPTDQTKSIMLARFPEKKPERDFAQEEKEFDLAFGAVRASRSISTSYGINSKLQGASSLLIPFSPSLLSLSARRLRAAASLTADAVSPRPQSSSSRARLRSRRPCAPTRTRSASSSRAAPRSASSRARTSCPRGASARRSARS